MMFLVLANIVAFAKIGPVILEKKIFKYFHYYLENLEKGRGPSFELIWILFTQECFVLSLVEISLVVLKKSVKSLR